MNIINYSSMNWLIYKINNRLACDLLKHVNGCVIDLGCGRAQFKKDVLSKADKYIGADWPSGLHEKSSVDIFADFTKTLPFISKSVDVILSFQVMEHLPEPGFFLEECLRILKPNGKLLLTTPFMWQVHEQPHDYFRYTRYGLEYLLKKAGFVDVVIEENTGFWVTWVLKFNYYTNRFAWGPLKLFLIPIWFVGQWLAPMLDCIDPRPEETASYSVKARKPGCL